MIDDTDRQHLQRCIELAAQALESGNEPFGSVLVSHEGKVLFEDHNRIGSGDHTRHPEFAIARWAAENLTAQDRARATVYTSGEHCPMCAAAHGWVGLGRIVFASSAAQMTEWLAKLGVPAFRVRPLAITDVIGDTPVQGPFDEFAQQVRELHVKSHSR